MALAATRMINVADLVAQRSQYKDSDSAQEKSDKAENQI
jgi:hypothetical protein